MCFPHHDRKGGSTQNKNIHDLSLPIIMDDDGDDDDDDDDDGGRDDDHGVSTGLKKLKVMEQ